MLKRIVLFVIFVVLVSNVQLFAENQEKDPFTIYQQDQTAGNFIEAFKHLNMQSDKLMLSYLLYMEMENALSSIEAEKDSLNYRSMFQYANLLLELNRFEQAIALYEKLNSAAPDWSCPWRHKGEAYYKSGDLVEAEIALKKAIETRIEHFDAYVMLAQVQKDAGKYKEALKTLETGLTYKGKDIEDPEEEIKMTELEKLHQDLIELN